MRADLVSVQTRDGVRLDGIFRKPAQEQVSQLGIDVVIFHHGVGGNFYHPSMFDAYSDALLDVGCAVLRVNNRGHDLVSRVLVNQAGHEPEVKRLGAAYEDMEACRHDWAAWVDFAHAAGYQRIGLWGHSLGATKSIYYMATQPDARVTCGVAKSCFEIHCLWCFIHKGQSSGLYAVSSCPLISQGVRRLVGRAQLGHQRLRWVIGPPS